MAKKKWFRILSYCPCCHMRVNTDRLTRGGEKLSWQFDGHSVVNGPGGLLVNLIGPIQGNELPRLINEQIALRLVGMLVDASTEFPWLREYVAESFKLGGYVKGVELDRAVDPANLDRPVEGVIWRSPEPVRLGGPVQSQLGGPVQGVPAHHVAMASRRAGLPAPTVQRSYLEKSVELQTPPDQIQKALNRLAGGRTSKANGV